MFGDDLFDDPYMNEMLLNPDLYGLDDGEGEYSYGPHENNDDNDEDDKYDVKKSLSDYNLYNTANINESQKLIKRIDSKNSNDEYDSEGLALKDKYLKIFGATYILSVFILIIIFFYGDLEDNDVLGPMFIICFILLVISFVYSIKYNLVKKKNHD